VTRIPQIVLIVTFVGFSWLTVDWLNGTLSSVREDGASGAGSLLKRERLGGAGRQ
jgi:hypothetical protein